MAKKITVKTFIGALSDPLGTISSSIASKNTTNQSNTDPTIQGTLSNKIKDPLGYQDPADMQDAFDTFITNNTSINASAKIYNTNLNTSSLFYNRTYYDSDDVYSIYNPLDPMAAYDPIVNSKIVTNINSFQQISNTLPQTYVERNDSAVIQLNTNEDKTDLAVPLTWFYPQGEIYTKIVDTSFQYFVDAESILDTLLPEDQEALRFEERFIDNDWVDGGELAFLVPSATKFRVGNTVKVVQDEGAAIAAYDGIWKVKKIVRNKKQESGSFYDAIQTNCPYIGNTLPTPGTITLF